MSWVSQKEALAHLRAMGAKYVEFDGQEFYYVSKVEFFPQDQDEELSAESGAAVVEAVAAEADVKP